MAKENEKRQGVGASAEPTPTEPQTAAGGTQPTEQAPAPRPNRDKYAAMFGEDNPDVDFEDKEARYGRMAEERERYRSLSKSGRGLSEALDKNRWLGAMFQYLAENPDKNPLVWLVDNGIDVKGALDDPEIMAQVDEAFKGWQQKQVDGEASERQKDENISKSLDALAGLQQELGLSDEQTDRMWTHFWDEVFAPAFTGEVSKDTWTAILHAMNYDSDIANAREESAMQARNEKHTNRLKNFEERQVPPSFSQGRGQRATQPKKKEGLWDDLKDYH